MDRTLEPTARLVERHAEYLRRVARALVHDEAAAQDVAQETWRVAFEQRGKEVERPRAWLAGIARRIAWKRLRDDERREAREREVARCEAPEHFDALDLGDRLQAAIRRLDEPFQGVVVQRYLHGLPPREIAQRSGTPVATVKSRLKRGLAALRADLDRRFEGGRRAWALALVTGFELPATPVAATGAETIFDSSSREAAARASTLTRGSLWSATALMNVKLLAASAVVVTASLWALQRDSSTSSGTVDLAAPPSSGELATVGLDLPSTSSSTARDEVARATADAPAAVAAEHVFSMEFELTDEVGAPYAGVGVQIAPPDHGFVTVGRTDDDGRLAVEWSGRVPSMVVDVAFVDGSSDLAGIHRVRVRSGRTREVDGQLVRAHASEYEFRSVDGHGIVSRISLVDAHARYVESPSDEERLPRRSPPRRARPVDLGDRRFGFASDADADRFSSPSTVPLIRGYLRVADSFGNEVSQVAVQAVESGGEKEPAFIEGFVSDEYGRPAAAYPVRYDAPGGSDALKFVLTDDGGRFRIETTVGETRCVAGPRGASVEQTFELAAGDVASWSPKVPRGRDLILVLASSRGHDVDGVVAQVRSDDGTRLWIGRGVADDRGRVTIPCCPSDTVDVELLAPEKVAPVPVATVESVRTGELFEHVLVEEDVVALPVTCTPLDGQRRERAATELLVFDDTDSFGARVACPGALDSGVQVVLPGGSWRLELATRLSGRTDLGPVLVVGEQPLDLGAIELDELGTLELPERIDPGATLEVVHQRDDVDTRVVFRTRSVDEAVADGAEEAAPGESNTLRVVPGEYRILWTDAAGGVTSRSVEVVAGQSTPVTAAR